MNFFKYLILCSLLSFTTYGMDMTKAKRIPANTLVLSDSDLKSISENLVKDFFKTRDEALVRENGDEAYRPTYKTGAVEAKKRVVVTRSAATQICDLSVSFADDWNVTIKTLRCSE